MYYVKKDNCGIISYTHDGVDDNGYDCFEGFDNEFLENFDNFLRESVVGYPFEIVLWTSDKVGYGVCL